MAFLLLQADLDRHPENNFACIMTKFILLLKSHQCSWEEGGVLVWIRHVASRCYASFPKQSCQCIAILSYDIHCICSLGPFLGHSFICWFSQNGDGIFVMHTKTLRRSKYYFLFSDQKNLDTVSELHGWSVARMEVEKHVYLLSYDCSNSSFS